MSADGFPLTSSTLRFHNEPENPNPNHRQQLTSARKTRKLPGTPDPESEVVALSPKTLMATNRFICEICNKGFQRDQNLQLHRRGHNLPWKLKQRTGKEVVRKKVYVCPERSCIHHDPSRALGDLTGIKKHYSRKHGEKKWKCEKCSKKYAVQSDWKAHIKICGTREYKCDCGTLFSRKDSFITHRAFCDALTEESARISSTAASLSFKNNGFSQRQDILEEEHDISQLNSVYRSGYPSSQDGLLFDRRRINLSLWLDSKNGANPHINPEYLPEYLQMPAAGSTFGSSAQVMNYGACSQTNSALSLSSSSIYGFGGEERKTQRLGENSSSFFPCNIASQQDSAAHLSATALLQKAAQMGASANHHAQSSASSSSSSFLNGFAGMNNSAKGIHPSVESKTEFPLFNPNQQGGFHQDFLLSSLPAVSSNSNGVMMAVMPAAGHERQLLGPSKMASWHQEVSRGMTRDFLGLGVEQTRPPFLQQEIVKFASMDPGMHLMSAPSFNTLH